MRTLLVIGSVLWEAPQNALGAVYYGVLRIAGVAERATCENGRLFIRTSSVGISLGHFVFYFDAPTRYSFGTLCKEHEFGHTFQSRWLGPLYLLAVGVPSSMRAIYAFAHREITGKRWRNYFDGYPERWADRLGGITVEQRRAAIRAEVGEA